MLKLRHGQTTEPTDDPSIVRLKGSCVFTGRTYEALVPRAGLERWVSRSALITEALPDASDDVRQFLMDGIHPEVFDSIFAEA